MTDARRKNVSLFLDHQVDQGRADRVAVVCGGERVYEPADPSDIGSGVAEEGLPAAATHEDDMAFWLYSSGSTGRPKGVVHRQADPAAVCETYGASVLKLTDADVTYSTTKLYHAYGSGNGIFFPYL